MPSKLPRSARRISVSLLALALVLAACTPVSGATRKTLLIATGQKGSTFASYGTALKTVFRSSLEDYEPVIKEQNGSPENVRLLARNASALGFVQGIVGAEAALGQGEFKRPVENLRALATLYSSYMHLVTLPDRKIRSWQDLKGKRISIGSKGTGTEVNAIDTLAALGFQPGTDLQVERLNTEDSVEALKEGRIDALFRTDGLPGPAIAKLAEERRIALVPLDEALLPLQQRHSGHVYSFATIPAGTYRGVPTTPTITTTNMLLVNESMDDDLAYQLTRTMFQHKDELARVEKEGRNLDPLAGQEVAPLQLHPGALRYYKERMRA